MRTLFNFTLGVDLGDKQSVVCIIDSAGTVQENLKVASTKKAFKEFFTIYSGEAGGSKLLVLSCRLSGISHKNKSPLIK